MDERLYWLGFALCSGVGPSKFAFLLKYFQTAKNAWQASQSELQHCAGRIAAALIADHRKSFSPKEYFEQLQEANADFIILTDDSYPQLLSKIQKPPYVLFIKGNSDILNDINQDKGFAIVGTRNITDYGRHITQTFSEDMAAAGYVIVSGLALGVDAVAHQAAIDAGGKTIAVLGCGIDCCNPRENTRLYEDILAHGGLIVSEYGLGLQPNRGTFPARNRIIAGLGVGILVTEGAEDSGSLITAKDAVTSGRKVYAVPGPITSKVSKGPILLITQGAKVVTTAKDILKDFGFANARSLHERQMVKGDTKEEQQIIDLLLLQDISFDELIKKTGLESSQIATTLSIMEMKGLIKTLSSGLFSLR